VIAATTVDDARWWLPVDRTLGSGAAAVVMLTSLTPANLRRPRRPVFLWLGSTGRPSRRVALGSGRWCALLVRAGVVGGGGVVDRTPSSLGAAAAVVGTDVGLAFVAFALSAVAPRAVSVVSLVVIGLCGWVATRLGRLPFRWALGVAGLLLAASVLVGWSGEVAMVDHMGVVLLDVVGVAAFIVGASAGARHLRGSARQAPMQSVSTATLHDFVGPPLPCRLAVVSASGRLTRTATR